VRATAPRRALTGSPVTVKLLIRTSGARRASQSDLSEDNHVIRTQDVPVQGDANYRHACVTPFSRLNRDVLRTDHVVILAQVTVTLFPGAACSDKHSLVTGEPVARGGARSRAPIPHRLETVRPDSYDKDWQPS